MNLVIRILDNTIISNKFDWLSILIFIESHKRKSLGERMDRGKVQNVEKLRHCFEMFPIVKIFKEMLA